MFFYELLEGCQKITESDKEAYELVKDIIEDIKHHPTKYLTKLDSELEYEDRCKECFGKLKQVHLGVEEFEVYGIKAYRQDYVTICEDCGEEY